MNAVWRELKIVLTRQQLAVHWNKQLVYRMSREEILDHGMPPDARYDTQSLKFEPRGGLGIFVYRSTLFVRNVRLTPITGE
jgi:hypothetical protein